MENLLLRLVLVLDAGYQAVNVVPMRRALSLLALGKAVSVEEEAGVLLHSERSSIRCPLVIRLAIAVAHRVYQSLRVRFNKRNVMARDSFACQYCGEETGQLTIDHVHPRSRRSSEFPKGGPTTWQNCVTACLDCNGRKGDRTPAEAGMQLTRRPIRPRWFLPQLHRKSVTAPHEAWRRFLTGPA